MEMIAVMKAVAIPSCSGDSSNTEPPVSEVSDHHSVLENAYSAARDASHVGRMAPSSVVRLPSMDIFPLK